MKKVALLVLLLASLSPFVFPARAHAACEDGPGAPKVWAKSGPKSGEITLWWESVSRANRYAVAYGDNSGSYIYGADNIGGESSTSYTVSHLIAGRRYFFRLAAARDCASSPFSAEVSAIAGGVVASVPAKTTIPSGTASNAASPVKTVPPVMTKEETVIPVDPTSGNGDSRLRVSAKPGPKEGEVSLWWQHPAESVDNYHLVYGTSANSYQYGALNIGKVTSFHVRYLVPGKTYYFALVPVRGGEALWTSLPVKTWAKINVEVVNTTKDVVNTGVMEKKPVATTAPVLSVTPTLQPQVTTAPSATGSAK